MLNQDKLLVALQIQLQLAKKTNDQSTNFVFASRSRQLHQARRMKGCEKKSSTDTWPKVDKTFIYKLGGTKRTTFNPWLSSQDTWNMKVKMKLVKEGSDSLQVKQATAAIVRVWQVIQKMVLDHQQSFTKSFPASFLVWLPVKFSLWRKLFLLVPEVSESRHTLAFVSQRAAAGLTSHCSFISKCNYSGTI